MVQEFKLSVHCTREGPEWIGWLMDAWDMGSPESTAIIADSQELMQTWVAPDGRWAIVTLSPNGVVCLRVWGRNYSDFPDEPTPLPGRHG